MAHVIISDVRKSYGALEVLHGVSVSIADGEFIVLVGPSGCGKSTLLRMIAGLEGISSGTISVDGHVVNTLSPKDRNVAMVFQNYALYPHMTVRENIGFPLRMASMDSGQISAKVKRAADMLGLKPLLDRRPRHLSGGQRQRVAMGRAIVREPIAFLFDEPLSNLDAQLRSAMRTELKALLQTLNTTAIYVTHDQVEAMTMADRVVVMRDGIIEQMGTPLELYDRPVNTFVAKFIGSPAMNLLPASVDKASGTLRLEGGMQIKLPEGAIPAEAVLLGFRPEHVRAGESGKGLRTRVAVIEPMGGQTQVLFKCGPRDITATFPGRIDFKVNDEVWLQPNIETLHVFNSTDGQRIL